MEKPSELSKDEDKATLFIIILKYKEIIDKFPNSNVKSFLDFVDDYDPIIEAQLTKGREQMADAEKTLMSSVFSFQSIQEERLEYLPLQKNSLQNWKYH